MDPLKPIVDPTAEVRIDRNIKYDNYGEAWVVIDGIETKVPSIAAAKELLARQDATRMQIRADLDATGIRDKTVKETIMIDGEEVEVEMVPMGLSGVFQVGTGLTSESEISDELFDKIKTMPVPKPEVTRSQQIYDLNKKKKKWSWKRFAFVSE